MKTPAGFCPVVVYALFLCGSSMMAGDAGWVRLYDGWRYATIYSVQETGDGGYIMAGANGTTYAGDLDDAMIAKLDRAGNFIWKKIVGGPGGDWFISGIETSRGDFLAAGKTWSAGYHPDGIWLVRISVSGTVIWNRSYKSGYYTNPTAIIELPAGGFVLVTQMSLMRLDDTGKVLSMRTYQDPWFRIDSIVRTADGGYFAVGLKTCAKLDGAGRVIWMKTFEDLQVLWGAAETGDGGYMAVGSYTREYQTYGVCMKLDSGGSIVWAEHFGAGSQCARVTSVGEGRTIVAGSIGTGYHGLTSRPWFLEVDEAGEILSQKIFQSDHEEGGWFGGIGSGSDGGALLSGSNWTFGKGVGWDGLLLRLPSAGGAITCPGLLRDSDVSAEPLSLSATDGNKDSVLSKSKWKKIRSFQADWDAAASDPCQPRH